MTSDKLNNVLLLLNDLYPNRAPAITERVIDIWMKCFTEYDDDIVDKAVMTAVKGCKYPPTINDLIESCERYKQAQSQIIGDIKITYREIVDLCPKEENTPDAWNAFKQCIKDDDIEISRKKAYELERRFMRAYRYRQNGEPLPSIIEWFNNQKWE